MKKLFIPLMAIFLTLSTNAIAAEDHLDHDHAHETIEHYEGKSLSSYEEAIKSFKDDMQKISVILESEKLSSTQLEAVHEISYGLEDAFEVIMIKDTKNLIDIKNTIEEVHLTSEDHEETRLRENFSKLLEKTKDI